MLEYASYALVLFSLAMYVVLDGYDLGVGMLSLAARPERRREYGEIVATAWDANESWIILVGVVLWAGLPGAYAAILPGVYLPLIGMLIAIILRGLGLEMQGAAGGYRRGWALLFGGASLAATVCQGLVLGAVLTGPNQRNGSFQGGAFDWLSFYGVLCALGLVAVYLLAGAAWLQDKTEGWSRSRVRRTGRSLLVATAVMAVVLGLLLSSSDPQQLQPGQPLRGVLFWLTVVGAVVAGAVAWHGFGRRPDWRPFAAVATMTLCGLLGLVALSAPVVVPPGLTAHQAASPHSSQLFLVLGVGVCMPFVLAYNVYAWRSFHGKYTDPVERPIPPLYARTYALVVSSTPSSSTPRTIVRRTLLVVLGILATALSQDAFGGVADWIGPVGVILLGCTALAAWIVGDRRDRRAGYFHADITDIAGIEAETSS
ncbi:cytochrome d ubiquinol oxidase subunit II [Streptomyces sp. NY05-11A]|uniref:cytochrome d ubiquinol oxidase subunit II n=1 Tax=Streptomyces soliscabiei TaxID=588897 RepID=UPI0029B6C6D7|nr:cytochrome d ubiquinol oxidase subunit II [Streptomyces sp. NY05-11A]MDX2681441.1 cytochrome d ubiquinol oxidase subunit II [Streptomyces sp. NY05-11A]